MPCVCCVLCLLVRLCVVVVVCVCRGQESGLEALAWPPTMSTPRNKDWELPRLPARRRQRSKHARGAYKGSIQT